MGKTRTCSLRQILQYAYRLRESAGLVDISKLPEAMLLANEKEIIASGKEVDLPDWRRQQLEITLAVRFPESIYYAVENGILPTIERQAKERERL